jgi:cytochrome c peroxidase
VRRLTRAALVLGGAAALTSVSRGRSEAAADAAVRRWLGDVARLDSAAGALHDAAARGDAAGARRALGAARLAYKRAEFLAEHYAPLTARAVNGPPAAAVDDEDPKKLIPPTGLQPAALALAAMPADLARAAREGAVLRVNARRLRELVGALRVTDAQLFDASRLEIARVVTLGLAGFDAPSPDDVPREMAAALDGVSGALSGYAAGTPARADFDRRLVAARRYLAGRDAASLDRYTFVTEHANPLARALVALRDAAGVAPLTDRRPFSAAAATVFDAGALDPQAYAPPDAPAPDAALVALGARLFHEPALSGRGDRSCATCHQPTRLFTDGRPRALPNGSRDTLRNTPTLAGAALQPGLLADGRFPFLEDQVAHVIASPAEMGGDLDAAARRLGLTPRRIRTALAAYVRTLAVPDAPFDRAMRGGEPLGAAERRGFDVFMGKGRCGTCHFAPLFGGVVPPAFAESELEVLGTPATRDTLHARVDPDLGAGALDRVPLHAHAFRTPSLRGVARTAPYMHNGVYRTLEEVVDFYDRGGAVSGARLPNRTLPEEPLRLTAAEKRDLVRFLRSLGG